MRLDILFIHPNASAEIYQELSREHSAIETPIWAGMLAEHVRRKNIGVRILDCEADGLDYVQSASVIKDINPRIACLVVYGQQPSASTQNMEGAVALVREIKKIAPDIKTVMVGGHVAALPNETLAYDAVDFVCQNEGVYTLANLASCDDLDDRLHLEKIDGLGWKSHGMPQLNRPSAIVPMDKLEHELPGVAWDLLPPPTKYRTAGWHSWPNNSVKSPFASLYTSLGCPFKCFPVGTKVLSHNGAELLIENVQVGDVLRGYNEKNGKTTWTEVIRLVRNEEKDLLVEVTFENGSSLQCTSEHPFYVRGGWVEAKDLKTGNEVLSTDGTKTSKSIVVRTNKVNLGKPIPVYNFECDPHSNYFVKLSDDAYVLSHNCSFCCINIINRTDSSPGVASDKSAIFRYWRPEYIIKEFDKLASMGVKNVKIADEMFVLKEQHFLELCKLLIERDYGFNIWCYSRVDTCKPHHLEMLKKAGVNFIGLGIESPNQTVRKDVIKGGYKEVKIIDIINLVRNAGIGVGANYIFGLPEDTLETMKETLDFAVDACTENFNIYSCMCYVGSPLYYEAIKRGWQLPDRYAGYSQHSYWTQNLPSNHASAAEVLKFRDEAWMKYFTNPSYLAMMRSKYGEEAVKNIESTTKIKLKRRLLGD